MLSSPRPRQRLRERRSPKTAGRTEPLSTKATFATSPSCRKAGSVDYVISNPPYFPAGSGESAKGEARQIAREETSCTLDDVCAAAQRVLRYGGRFTLVHRAERLADVLCAMRSHGIEPKRLRFLAKSPDAAPSLLFVEGKRGGKSGLVIEPPLVPNGEEWDAVYFRK